MFLDLDFDILGDLENHEIFTDLVNSPQQPAACYDLVSFRQFFHHLLVLPGLLHLRPDEKEIKHDKNEDQGEKSHETASPLWRRLLGAGRLNEKIEHGIRLKSKRAIIAQVGRLFAHGIKIRGKVLQSARFDGLPQTCQQRIIIMYIVEGIEPRPQDLIGPVKVM